MSTQIILSELVVKSVVPARYTQDTHKKNTQIKWFCIHKCNRPEHHAALRTVMSLCARLLYTIDLVYGVKMACEQH